MKTRKIPKSADNNRSGKSVNRRFILVGNHLCVDFANTVYDPNDPAGTLRSWNDLVDFLEAAGVANRSEATWLRALGVQGPGACAEAFIKALSLRDSLRNVLTAIEARGDIPANWIEEINAVLQAGEGYEQLVSTKTGWRLLFIPRSEEPLRVLVSVARSAAKLIEEGAAAPIRKCGNPNCVLYFYDVSPTLRRRWCSMEICGNRMKVAAYARRRQKRKRLLK